MSNLSTPNINQLKAALRSAPEVEHPLPEITITNKPVAQLSQEALESLQQKNQRKPFLFIIGQTPVRLITRSGQFLTQAISADGLKHILNRSATWYRLNLAGEKIFTDCTEKVVKDILAFDHLPFPVLRGFTHVPLFTADGQLRTSQGYQSDLEYYLNLSPEVQDICVEAMPSEAAVTEAVDWINTELFSGFPFKDEASRANTWALLLLPFIRHLMDGPTPLHLIDAPTPGSGKTLLASLITTVATGASVPVLSEAHTREEWQKVLLAKLQTAPAFVVIDNLSRKLDSGDFASVLTSKYWSARVLGSTQTREVEVSAIFIATGNNTQVSPEICRRTVHIRLLPKEARPHERNDFRHGNLLGWVEQNRPMILQACLTIIAYWFSQGKPDGGVTFNSYNRYAQIITGILGCAGIVGFNTNQRELYEQADDETAQWEQFVQAWWGYYKDEAVTSAQLVNLPGFNDLAEDLIGKGKTDSQAQRLGRALQRKRDVIFDCLQIKVSSKTRTNKSAFYLQNTADHRGTSGIVADSLCAVSA